MTMCLTSIFYTDTTSLNADAKAKYDANRNPGTYSFKDFKKEVLSWLIKNFGTGVRAGKKAIFIQENGSRRDADVLVCVEHRN
jgi:hypothetical protein